MESVAVGPVPQHGRVGWNVNLNFIFFEMKSNDMNRGGLQWNPWPWVPSLSMGGEGVSYELIFAE